MTPSTPGQVVRPRAAELGPGRMGSTESRNLRRPTSGGVLMECRTSKRKLLGLLGLTCIMVGGSYFCTTLPDIIARVVGWIGMEFFGLGFVVFPVLFFRTDAQVIINDEGIEDRR